MLSARFFLTLSMVAPSATTELSFDLAGIQSIDEVGTPGNEFRTAGVGQDTTFTEIFWENVQGTGEAAGLGGASWGTEMRMAVGNGVDVTFTVAFFPNADGAGSWGPADSAGWLDLASSDIDPITVLANQLLTLEFYENYDDYPGATDAVYISGTFKARDAPPPPPCRDTNNDGKVDGKDLAIVLGSWRKKIYCDLIGSSDGDCTVKNAPNCDVGDVCQFSDLAIGPLSRDAVLVADPAIVGQTYWNQCSTARDAARESMQNEPTTKNHKSRKLSNGDTAIEVPGGHIVLSKTPRRSTKKEDSRRLLQELK